MTHVLLGLAALAYCVAGMAYLWFLVGAEPLAARLGQLALAGGLALHAGALAVILGQNGLSPAVDVQQALSLLAWLIGVVFLVINQWLGLPILGAFVVPLMLAIALPALSLPGPTQPLPPALHTALLPLHVLAAILGYAAFGLASLVGVAYLLQESDLKTRQTLDSLWARLPSLELMDQLNRRLTTFGFIVFTLAIVSGAFFARGVWGQALSLEPTEVMAAITWALYGALLWGRIQSGWRGRRAALLTLVGFSLAMVSFIGLSFWPAGRHSGTFQ